MTRQEELKQVKTRQEDLVKQLNELKDQIAKQNEVIDSQNIKINSLNKKINYMSGQICQMKSEMIVTSHVSELLKQQLDDSVQYSRRNCLILDGVDVKNNENENSIIQDVKEILETEVKLEKEVINDIDRAHRIGPYNGDRQSIIIKFKSFSSRTRTYYKRKQLK